MNMIILRTWRMTITEFRGMYIKVQRVIIVTQLVKIRWVFVGAWLAIKE